MNTDIYIGSPYNIQPGKCKNFFIGIDKAYAATNCELIEDNLAMIYIRYALSILLATRDFTYSCDLTEYSKYLHTVTIHEKEKNKRSSKRIIPVCHSAKKMIDAFFTIKTKYNLSHNRPMLILHKENDFTFEEIKKDAVINFIENNNIIIDLQFISYVPLRFGRHIVTSHSCSSPIRDEYLQAFLNHFSFGAEDQGMYSTFDNREYIRVIANYIEGISLEFLPSYGIYENYL